MTAAEAAGAAPGPLAPMLSCLDANIEVLLRHAGVTETAVLTALGALCSLDVAPPELPVLTPLPREAWIERCTGLRLTQAPASTGAELIESARAVVGSGSPVLIVADAFTVPWNPYAGHEHHEHGFVVDGFGEGTVHVVDAYTNTTRYGPTDPGARWVDSNDLISGLRPAGDHFELRHLVGEVTAADPAALAAEAIAANTRAWRAAEVRGRDAAALVAFAEDGLDLDGLAWLSLAVWLITRNRQAHAEWWRRQGAASASEGAQAAVAEAAESVLEQWRSIQAVSYLAWRRVEAGKPCPTTLAATLTGAAKAESDWFQAMAAALS